MKRKQLKRNIKNVKIKQDKIIKISLNNIIKWKNKIQKSKRKK